MSYSIFIGNTRMRPVDDEDEDEEGYTTNYARQVGNKIVYYEPVVDEIRLPDAPTFPNDEMTGNSNGRHPGYNQWAEFCREAGLYILFFDKEQGLMREHPGHQPLSATHAQSIEKALIRRKKIHPNAAPGFEAFSWDCEDIAEVGYDPTVNMRPFIIIEPVDYCI